jgi:topoisomerase IV subunit A
MNPDEIEKLELSGDESYNSQEGQSVDDTVKKTLLSGMYQNWFLDYASYVILERAVPHINDGLKPVQRRILHAMKRLDDGRYNKVANIIGHTMQFHPHGDASIGDALVQLGQKDILIDAQGNWGNILTGDRAAAPRYIEARLSKFALEVVFNPKTTAWKLSYDGRNKEPITLPMKFPLLLNQGVEGIAVGLASKILPHNFNELIDASIDYLLNKDFILYPDFLSGGLVDVTKYNKGERGGSVRVRARITKEDKKTLVITEIPFGKTTSTLIESIVKANEKGKIKIKKIDDNTSEFVEIVIHLAAGVSPDVTIDALYAFTDCEIAIYPNCCIIEENIPKFLNVNDILKHSTNNTLELLRTELEIRMNELNEAWHMSSLEKIFIEKRIYRDIEECETWEAVLVAIDKGLDPYKKLLRRKITEEDITKLTEIKIKRISKYDSFKADEQIKGIEDEMGEVQNHLDNIVDYTVNYFKQIKKKYGKGRDRKTEIRNFDTIEAAKVVVANEKLFVNRAEGFIGTSLKKDEFVSECSDIDDVIVFRKDGKYLVTKVSDKAFVGKDIIHIGIFQKNDERTIYNMVYSDGKSGPYLMKRFPVKGVTRDKEYDATKGKEYSKVLYFSCNPNGEAEVLNVRLKPKPKLKKPLIELDFSELAIKGRSSMGNILTKHAIHKITVKEKGISTLGGQDIWFDETVLKLNTEERGSYIGEFKGEDKILVVTQDGTYKLIGFDVSYHFDNEPLVIEKFNRRKIFTAVYIDGEQKLYYIKRFQIEGVSKEVNFISEAKGSELILLQSDKYPILEIVFGGKNKDRSNEQVDVEEFIGIKSYKAKGKRLTNYDVKKIVALDPKEVEEEEEDHFDDENGVDFIDDEENGEQEIVLEVEEKVDEEVDKKEPILEIEPDVEEEKTKKKKPKAEKEKLEKTKEKKEFPAKEIKIEETKKEEKPKKKGPTKKLPGSEENGQITFEW